MSKSKMQFHRTIFHESDIFIVGPMWENDCKNRWLKVVELLAKSCRIVGEIWIIYLLPNTLIFSLLLNTLLVMGPKGPITTHYFGL